MGKSTKEVIISRMDSSLYNSIETTLNEDGDYLPKILNALSLLHEALGEKSWVGLYMFDEKTNTLRLGPFQGSPACLLINPGKGVVGTCYAAKKPLYVDDVREFKGYISCDASVKSEVCFPLFLHDEVIAILDIDSPTLDGLKSDLPVLMQIAHLFER